MNSPLWQAVLGEIELSISAGNYHTWFKNTQLVEQSDELVVIGVPNIFIKSQLEKKFNDLVVQTLQKNGVRSERIEYRIVAMEPRPTNSSEPILSESVMNITVPRPNRAGSGISHAYRQGLNERYTFDNFIVGSSNELAFAACQSITAKPGTKYNPLLLYGGVGIGKTHLIQAVGNAILANNPDASVLYITTEQFVQEFVEALRYRKTTEFANHYRSADVFIVDDIQFITGKEKIQEEFFHTFNSLHQANKQIIISADRPPKDIVIDERLQSRFAWGMSIDMQAPDYETRCAIVQAKAQVNDITLPNDVVEYLSTNINTNVRELEGALNQLLAFCEMRSLQPNLDIALSVIGSSHNRPKHLSAKQIIERTAKHFQVPIEDILGPKRDKDIVVPRQVAMYILREELHLSFPKIARELGRKDHTTAIHSVDKIEKESQIDSSLRSAISEIKERLYA
ncbi:chromosomal replication initiator protein DnaA [Patescibacteria group bacterium]|nr:chromosomal replication initiator protein DnaA [Patescibacteria group bacterium]